MSNLENTTNSGPKLNKLMHTRGLLLNLFVWMLAGSLCQSISSMLAWSYMQSFVNQSYG